MYYNNGRTAVGPLAQPAERGADNAKVVSSTLTRTTTISFCVLFAVFVVFVVVLFSQKTPLVCQDILYKITALQLLCIILLLQQRFLWFTLYFKQPRRAKVTTLAECLITLVIERKTFYELPLPHSL